MLVFVTNAAGGFQSAFRHQLRGLLGIPGCTSHHGDSLFIEDFDGTAAHSTGYDDIDSEIMQEDRQKTRPVTWIGNNLTRHDFLVVRCKDGEILTMAKVSGYIGAFAGYGYFHDWVLLVILFYFFLMLQAWTVGHKRNCRSTHNSRNTAAAGLSGTFTNGSP